VDALNGVGLSVGCVALSFAGVELAFTAATLSLAGMALSLAGAEPSAAAVALSLAGVTLSWTGWEFCSSPVAFSIVGLGVSCPDREGAWKTGESDQARAVETTALAAAAATRESLTGVRSGDTAGLRSGSGESLKAKAQGACSIAVSRGCILSRTGITGDSRRRRPASASVRGSDGTVAGAARVTGSCLRGDGALSRASGCGNPTSIGRLAGATTARVANSAGGGGRIAGRSPAGTGSTSDSVAGLSSAGCSVARRAGWVLTAGWLISNAGLTRGVSAGFSDACFSPVGISTARDSLVDSLVVGLEGCRGVSPGISLVASLGELRVVGRSGSTCSGT